ncbi:hypothetical protein PHAVU_004G100400 [Phaseolus vulgaris]
MDGRFLNGNMPFRDCSQSQFNYHDQVPHHGWDFRYAGGTYVPHHGRDFHPAGGTYLPHHTSEPTISALGPLHSPQPRPYCKICEVKMSSYKHMEEHNRGKKHQRMLKVQEREKLRISNGQIPNSPKRILKSGENGCTEKKVISEATVAKNKNYVQKDKGVTPEVPDERKPRDNNSAQGGVTPEDPAKGKPRDNTSSRGHNFKRKIGGVKTGKYMKTNDGVRRPMESSKLDINSLSASVESPVQIPALAPYPGVTSHTMAPSSVVGSSFKYVYQHNLPFQTQVLEGKEYHEIQNPTVETRNHPHASSYSNINTQPEAVSSDSAAKITEKNWHPLKNMSSDASISEHKNYPQKGMGLTSEFAAKGPEMKPTDNSGGQSNGFNHKSRRAETGKYTKKNDVVRRPMESSKLNIDFQLKSVESPVQNSIPSFAPLPGPVASHIIAPTLLVESSLEPQIQHISSSQTPLSEGNEHYEIENPNVEVTDQPPAPADSNINIQTEDMGSDSSTMAMAPSLAVTSNFEPQNQHVLQTCLLESTEHLEIHNPTLKTNYKPPTSAISISGLQIQHVLHIETESRLSEGTTDSESLNCAGEKDNQLLPSVLAEFNSSSCLRANAHSGDGCSNHEQKMDIITRQSGTTQRSQLAVCLKCGDVGFRETLVFCKKCQVYALHRYCLDGPVIFTGDVNWFCGCEPEVVETSEKNVSLNSANISFQNSIERVKNKQGPQNIEDKTMVLLSDNHSLSHHGLSQCSDTTEKEKFGKECQPAPKDEANNTEASMIVTVPLPIADPVWRGSMCLFNPSIRTVVGLMAHMSTLACSKVLEETKFFPDVLCPDLLSRTAVWPMSFMNCGPNEDSIALYFFPDSESVESSFDKLVDHMMSRDLAIRAVVENADLLIFPSLLLPIQSRRFQEKYYLWGVFRAKKNFTQYK